MATAAFFGIPNLARISSAFSRQMPEMIEVNAVVEDFDFVLVLRLS